jgi:hypothetical protein
MLQAGYAKTGLDDKNFFLQILSLEQSPVQWRKSYSETWARIFNF